MPSKDRNKLWALSAGRYAICNTMLICSDNTSNIGKEFHIISQQKGGPRYQPNLSDYNNYENYILLCANHHKEIDSNLKYYTVEVLKRIKKNHELKIEKQLNEKNYTIEILSKITSGNKFCDLIWGCHSTTIFSNSTDCTIINIKTELDDLIGNMMNLQKILNSRDKLVFHHHLDKYIKQIDKLNHGLYANTHLKCINGLRYRLLRIIINKGKSNVLLIKHKSEEKSFLLAILINNENYMHVIY